VHAVVDALGRTVELASPARRIVSLVPSETESVAELVGLGALVGRTDFCEEPAGAIEGVPSVGGTKKFDVDAVLALRPDLVLANQEENGRSLVERLFAAGVPVHVSFPHTVVEALSYLRSLALLLGRDPDQEPVLARARAAVEAQLQRARSEPALDVFVPIWKDPWMTFDGRSFASDLLDLCGARNVFSDRPRRYPLAADLGQAVELPPSRTEGRDTRYPRVPLDEVRQRRPRAVLLPDEPYRFGPSEASELEAAGIGEPGGIQLVSGKDLFWYGTRLGPAIERVATRVAELRGRTRHVRAAPGDAPSELEPGHE
jgi:hypothetical protein